MYKYYIMCTLGFRNLLEHIFVTGRCTKYTYTATICTFPRPGHVSFETVHIYTYTTMTRNIEHPSPAPISNRHQSVFVHTYMYISIIRTQHSTLAIISRSEKDIILRLAPDALFKPHTYTHHGSLRQPFCGRRTHIPHPVCREFDAGSIPTAAPATPSCGALLPGTRL